MRTETEHDELSFDDFDETNHPRPAETGFGRLSGQAISRRRFLEGGAGVGLAALLAGAAGLAPSPAAAGRLGFRPVAANGLDTVTVPEGCGRHVVAKRGDPLWSKPIAFDQATRGSGASQELAFGDNNDGMRLFADGGRSVLAVNNEHVNRKIVYGGAGDGRPRTAADPSGTKALDAWNNCGDGRTPWGT